MAICPVCNAFERLEKSCHNCQSHLNDKGRVTDYYDPYGHYNDIETVKSADGYLVTVKSNLCPHLLHCDNCQYETVKFVQEV